MTTPFEDLVTWLREQLDEDERLARACPPWPWRLNDEGDEVWAADGIQVAETFALSGPQQRATAAHIVRWDSARVLRLVEVQRRELDRLVRVASDVRIGFELDLPECCGCALSDPPPAEDAEAEEESEDEGPGETAECRCGRVAAVERLVLRFAQRFADLPGFREDWRVDA